MDSRTIAALTLTGALAAGALATTTAAGADRAACERPGAAAAGERPRPAGPAWRSGPTWAFRAPPGGVMTATEWGVISGELWLRVLVRGRLARVEIAYAETADWYPVEGGPLRLRPNAPTGPADLRALSARVAAHLASAPTRPPGDNPAHTDLRGFRP